MIKTETVFETTTYTQTEHFTNTVSGTKAETEADYN